MAQDVYIVGAARLPIGKFGGSLARLSLTELGTTAASAAIERSGIPAAEIDTAVASNVIPVIPSDLYISRKVAIGVGMPESSTAMGVNRLCGSGVQAVVSAAQLLQSGDGTVALAIGAESMSQAPTPSRAPASASAWATANSTTGSPAHSPAPSALATWA